LLPEGLGRLKAAYKAEGDVAIPELVKAGGIAGQSGVEVLAGLAT
jgi:hypothetical protein